jgi:hypothetical protein
MPRNPKVTASKLPACSGLQRTARRDGPGRVCFGSECRHGFNASPACHGISAETVLPECCREEWCGWLYERTGGAPDAK